MINTYYEGQCRANKDTGYVVLLDDKQLRDLVLERSIKLKRDIEVRAD